MAKLYTKTTWTDEVLAGNERFHIKADDGTPIESNVQIELATAVAQAGTAVDAEKMNNIENGIDGIDTLVDSINGKVTNLQLGWIALPPCTYVSATSFTLEGDWTAMLRFGAKWKGTNTTLKFGYVLSSSYSSGTGLTTVNLVANASYALASAAISGAYVSYANPPDFPKALTFTPAPLGLTTPTIAGAFCSFSVQNGLVSCWGRLDITSWAGQTGYIRWTLPLNIMTEIDDYIVGMASYYRQGGSTEDGSKLAKVSGNQILMFNDAGSDNVLWEASARVILSWMAVYPGA
ncbi:MAG TPA: hypothetical protein VFF68_03000 [Anaerolineaceae bacterium]|nr:hypothetical protein [Anaerolineaceae bacterium]